MDKPIWAAMPEELKTALAQLTDDDFAAWIATKPRNELTEIWEIGSCVATQFYREKLGSDCIRSCGYRANARYVGPDGVSLEVQTGLSLALDSVCISFLKETTYRLARGQVADVFEAERKKQ